MSVTLFNIGIYLAVLVTMVDQGSKFWILKDMLSKVTFVEVTSYLNFHLSWNTGVTFGLLADYSEWMPYVLSGVALAIVAILLNWLRRAETMYAALGLGFVMGGAVGNVIDRLQYGAVVDFLDFHVGGYHWYSFNVADSAIVLGVGLLLLENLLEKSHKGL